MILSAFWLGLSLLLGGCAGSGLQLLSAELVRKEAAKEKAHEIAQPHPLSGEPTIPERFPELRAMLEKMRASNPEREAAAQRATAAEAALAAQRAQRLPQIMGSLAGTSQRSISEKPAESRLLQAAQGVGNQARATVDLRWDPDLWGRKEAEIEAAQARLQAARLELQALERSLDLELARAYFEELGYGQRLALNALQQEAARKLLALIEAKAQQGLVSEREAHQVRLLLQQLRAQQQQLALGRAQALRRLEQLLGETLEAKDSFKPLLLREAVAKPAPDLSAWQADLVRARPDVRAAEQRLAAALASAAAAERAQLPSFPLSGSLAEAARHPIVWWREAVLSWSLVWSISGLLWDGGRLEAEARAAEHSAAEAAANYQAAVLRAVKESAAAFDKLQLQLEREKALGEALQAAEKARTLMQAQYQAGLVDLALVLDAERQRIAAEDAWVEARMLGHIARAELEIALGVAW